MFFCKTNNVVNILKPYNYEYPKIGVPVGLCCDHAGYELKNVIIGYLESQGIAYKDFGTFSDPGAVIMQILLILVRLLSRLVKCIPLLLFAAVATVSA